LQTMADQVAVALENARLFAEREQALETAQRAYGDLSRQAWREMLQTQSRLAYRSDEHGIADAGDVWRPEMERVLQTGRTVRGGRGEAAEGQRTLTVPIKVRGEIVGVLDTYKPAEAGDWTAEEIALLESIAEQLDPALESARLYQDTQRRAAREQTIRQVTERMRRAVDVEAILQNTVTELARAMGAPRAYVRLGTETELRSSRAQHVGEETGVDPEPQPPHGQGSFLRNEGLSTLQSEGEDVDA
jgi:GAF domain-containing protein